MKIDNPVQKAIRIYGSQSRLAEDCGVSQPTISLWSKNGKPSAEYAIRIENLTKGQISRHELRPDIYPLEEVRGSRDTQ